MQKEQSLQQQMIESEIQFRNQFDPNSQSHHKGLTVVVPVGGNRIPESMSSMFPEGYDPNAPQQVIDYGHQYKKVQDDRNVYQNFKKALAKLCPIVQAFLRHDQIFKEKGDPTNEKHIKTHEENIAKEKANLVKVQEQLKEYIAKLDAIDAEGAEMAKELISILEDKSLTDFNFKVKKTSTKSFSEGQKCLQKLKDIKKNYKKPESTV